MVRSLATPSLSFVIPAKAGIHFSAARAVARWIPAFAGTTIDNSDLEEALDAA
jgi:hypothetical protein